MRQVLIADLYKFLKTEERATLPDDKTYTNEVNLALNK